MNKSEINSETFSSEYNPSLLVKAFFNFFKLHQELFGENSKFSKRSKKLLMESYFLELKNKDLDFLLENLEYLNYFFVQSNIIKTEEEKVFFVKGIIESLDCLDLRNYDIVKSIFPGLEDIFDKMKYLLVEKGLELKTRVDETKNGFSKIIPM